MSSLATLHTAIRLDLDDVAEAIFDDDLIDRAVDRALREYSKVSPLEVKTTLQTATDSRDVDVSSLTPRIAVVAAEYPTGSYPPEFVPFSLWADTLTLDLQTAPSGTPDVAVYWHKVHAINGSVTFPATDDDIITTGAGAFAVQTASNSVANKVNVGGEDAWGRYEEWARKRMAEFYAMLAALPAAGKLRTRSLYAPVGGRFKSQTTDPGPV